MTSYSYRLVFNYKLKSLSMKTHQFNKPFNPSTAFLTACPVLMTNKLPTFWHKDLHCYALGKRHYLAQGIARVKALLGTRHCMAQGSKRHCQGLLGRVHCKALFTSRSLVLGCLMLKVRSRNCFMFDLEWITW